jgi:hypothetical protein
VRRNRATPGSQLQRTYAPLRVHIKPLGRLAMNIGIIGASGNIGRRILTEALRRRHSVTAFTRDASRAGSGDATSDPVVTCYLGFATYTIRVQT